MMEKNKTARNKALVMAVIIVGLMALALLSTASAGTNSWTAVNTGLSNLHVKSLAVSPVYATDATLFAGTGAGIFKSTNGGQNWGASGALAGTIHALALSPNFGTPNTITAAFAGTDNGVFESTNSGTSWFESTATAAGVTSFAVSPKLQPGKD